MAGHDDARTTRRIYRLKITNPRRSSRQEGYRRGTVSGGYGSAGRSRWENTKTVRRKTTFSRIAIEGVAHQGNNLYSYLFVTRVRNEKQSEKTTIGTRYGIVSQTGSKTFFVVVVGVWRGRRPLETDGLAAVDG